MIMIDVADPAANMYGCPPCPGCGGAFMYPPNLSKTGGKLRARCDDCGHEEDAVDASVSECMMCGTLDLHEEGCPVGNGPLLPCGECGHPVAAHPVASCASFVVPA